MRLSTNTIYNMSTMSILQQQGRVAHVRQQLASGDKILSPADAPRDAAQALVVGHSLAVNEQYTATRDIARRYLNAQTAELGSITNALQAAVPLLVQGSTETLSDDDLDAVAKELKGVYHQLINSANAKDGSGNYMFSGYKINVQAFTESAGDYSYTGDGGHLNLQISGSRLMSVSHTGAEIFATVTDSAKYVTTPAGKYLAPGDNTGTATFGDLHVTDPTDPEIRAGEDYRLVFDDYAVDGTVDQYMIYNVTTGTAVTATPQTYTAGDPIAVGGGLSITVDGEPGAGDSFVIAQGPDASNHSDVDQNILNTIHNVVLQLEQGTETEHDRAALRNVMNSALRKVKNSLDNVLMIQAEVGASMNELESIDGVGSNREINYKTTLSGLQDLDFVKAASEYALGQVALKMAQKTFQDIQRLSLF